MRTPDNTPAHRATQGGHRAARGRHRPRQGALRHCGMRGACSTCTICGHCGICAICGICAPGCARCGKAVCVQPAAMGLPRRWMAGGRTWA